MRSPQLVPHARRAVARIEGLRRHQRLTGAEIGAPRYYNLELPHVRSGASLAMQSHR